MNQPLFKMGDKVYNGGIAFIVRSIDTLADGSYRYQHPNQTRWYHESDLELVKEPRKKKLYAYSCPDEVIFVLKDKGDKIKDHSRDMVFTRASEYDLDFSLGYACHEVGPK